MIQPIRVFVYGTLKPGEYNYQRYCQGKTIAEQSAIALGELFTLPVGYPALIPGEQPVRGFVLTFNDPQILADLDRLEGYSPQNPPNQNEYDRQQIEIWDEANRTLGFAWAYLMSRLQVERLGGVKIASGNWCYSPPLSS
ncbi:gamma-glutamylcyclotransferase [Kamptonema cortianum]|nr:gamma-glutamylcyclotransferase [Kamptonema cortianum]